MKMPADTVVGPNGVRPWGDAPHRPYNPSGSLFQTRRETRERPAKDGRTGESAKNVKIDGTNSTSPLESIKVPKNELKTNWF
jgi:hypothetical protein